MIRFRKFLPLVAVLLGAAILGMPTQAGAAFEITLKSGLDTIVIPDNFNDGFGVGFDDDNNPALNRISIDVTLNGLLVNVQITGDNNQTGPFGPPGPFDEARMHQTAISITNPSGSLATLDVFLSATGFTFPGGTPLQMSSSVSGTASAFDIVGGEVMIFQSYFDDANNLYGGSAIGVPGTSFTTGPQTSVSATVNAQNTLDIGFTPGTSAILIPGSVPFSLTQHSTFILAAGANVTMNAQTVVSVPGPGGVALLTAALPFLGLGYWHRRQKTKTQNA